MKKISLRLPESMLEELKLLEELDFVIKLLEELSDEELCDEELCDEELLADEELEDLVIRLEERLLDTDEEEWLELELDISTMSSSIKA